MSKSGVDEQLYQAALIRMNYTFELDAKTEQNVRNVLAEAAALLRREAGNPGLDFADEYNRTLLLDCAWYIINHKKAEFCQVHSDELTTLRLMEGFCCGKENAGV